MIMIIIIMIMIMIMMIMIMIMMIMIMIMIIIIMIIIIMIITFIGNLIGNKIEKLKFTYLRILQIYIIFTIGILKSNSLVGTITSC